PAFETLDARQDPLCWFPARRRIFPRLRRKTWLFSPGRRERILCPTFSSPQLPPYRVRSVRICDRAISGRSRERPAEPHRLRAFFGMALRTESGRKSTARPAAAALRNVIIGIVNRIDQDRASSIARKQERPSRESGDGLKT